MMPLCIHRLPKAIGEPERQTTDFSVSYRDRIVRKAVLVHNHIVDWHLARDPPNDVAAPIGSDGIITISE